MKVAIPLMPCRSKNGWKFLIMNKRGQFGKSGCFENVFFLIQYKVVVRCLLLKIFENAMFSCNFSVAGLPTYSNPPIFTPIFDLVTAASDFRDFTPISET